MTDNFHATIRVRFLTSGEGGRQTDVTGDVYACPMFIDGEAFDCRIYLNGKTLTLGETYDVPVKFLNRELVLPRLATHKRVKLWEGKCVADAEVIHVNS
jgi:hypothetical protein